MSKQPDMNVGIPPALITKVDEFLKTEDCKELGVTSRRQLMIMIVRDWLKMIQEGKSRGYSIDEITSLSIIDSKQSGKNIQSKKIQELEESIKEIHKKYEELENMIITTIKNPNIKIGFKNSQSVKKKSKKS